MVETVVTGWDVSGAHLKVAQVDHGRHLVTTLQLPCRLWLGMEELTRSLREVQQRLQPTRRHGMTMTGELAGLFADRTVGGTRLGGAMAEVFAGSEMRVYAGQHGFVLPEGVDRRASASANWHASARFVAGCCGSALFVDIGSRSTDIVPVRDGQVDNIGYSDEERLSSQELVYTGVTRTPVTSIAEDVPFAGRRQRVMADSLATMADVHRLTGDLAEDVEPLPNADSRGKTVEDSARRLARMLGRDPKSAPPTDWRRLAVHLAEQQRQVLHDAVDLVLSGRRFGDEVPVVGAGVGRFLARTLAERLRRPYVDFAGLVEGDPPAKEWAARCAPAAAVAILAIDGW